MAACNQFEIKGQILASKCKNCKVKKFEEDRNNCQDEDDDQDEDGGAGSGIEIDHYWGGKGEECY